MAIGEAYKQWAVFTDSTSMTSFICLCLLPAEKDPPMLPEEVVGQRLPLRVIGPRATCEREPGGGGLSINYGTAVIAIQTEGSASSTSQPAGSRCSPIIEEQDEGEDAER